MISVSLMAIPTLSIGLLPSYTSIGIAAPILFIVIRLLQGVSIGGELPGAMVILTEQAAENRRAFTSSMALVGIMLGMLCGWVTINLLNFFLDQQAMLTWGWRIPYLISIIYAGVAIYLRSQLLTMNQHHSIAGKQQSLKNIIKQNFPAIVKGMRIQCIPAIAFGLLILHMPTYLSHYLHFATSSIHYLATILLIYLACTILLFSALADRYNHLFFLRLGALGLILFPIPLFYLMAHNFIAPWLVYGTLVTSLAMYMSVSTVTMIDLFNQKSRYISAALAHGIIFGIVGGSAPLVATALISLTGWVFAPAFYIVLGAFIAFTAIVKCH